MYTINDLYDLDHTLAKDYLSQFTYPWEALKGIKDFILQLGPALDPEEYEEVSENVWVHKTAKVFPSEKPMDGMPFSLPVGHWPPEH